MQYISICNKCGKRIESATPRYFCDECRNENRNTKVVAEIEKLLRENKYRGKDIAKKFDVSVAYVSKIKRRIGLVTDYEELK